MESSFKSPYALLPDSLSIATQAGLSQVAKRLKKEYLAEFAVGNKSHLIINGASWLKSEVIEALEDLANPLNHHHLIIIRQGWIDFWNGSREIPDTISNLSLVPEKDLASVKASLLTILEHKTIEALSLNDVKLTLSLLKVGSAFPPHHQDKIDQCVFRLLHQEATAWSEWAVNLSKGLQTEEINHWFPMKREELICSLPARFSAATENLAQIRVNVSDILARSIPSKKQRRILVPSFAANPNWRPYLRIRWDGYKQFLNGLQSEQQLSAPAIIAISLAISVAMFVGGLISGGSTNRVELYDPPWLKDSIYRYSPADWIDPVDWTNMDSSLRYNLQQLDSLPTLTPDTINFPQLPVVKEPTWAEVIRLSDSIISSRAYQRLSDTGSVDSDSLPEIPQDSVGKDPISQSTP